MLQPLLNQNLHNLLVEKPVFLRKDALIPINHDVQPVDKRNLNKPRNLNKRAKIKNPKVFVHITAYLCRKYNNLGNQPL